MGKILRALALLAALTLLMAGGTAAVLVGPDDDVWLPHGDTRADPGQLLVTDPQVTAYDGLTLLVRAEAEGGVLLGVGHAVDVADLAAQVEHHEVTRVVWRGFDGGQRDVEASLPVPLPAPGELDVLRAQAHGPGPQTLRLDLDGTPSSLYVQPLDAGGAVSLDVGAHVEGIFLGALVTAGLGLLLLVLTVWRMQMARRRRQQGAPTTVQAAAPGAPAKALVRAAAAGSLAVALTGCGTVPSAAPVSGGRVGMTADQVGPVLDRHVAEYGKAVRRANTTPRRAGWEQVATGPLLAAHESSQVLRGQDGPKFLTGSLAGSTVYSPALAAYPLWAFVEADARGGETSVDEDRRPERNHRLVVMVRESAASGWKEHSFVDLPKGRLPRPLEGTAAVAPPKVLTAVRRLADDSIAFMNSKARPGFTPDVRLKQLRRGVRTNDGNGSMFARTDVVPAPGDDPDDVRGVAVEGGHLVLSVRTVRKSMWFRPNDQDPPGWRGRSTLVNGDDGRRLYWHLSVMTLAFVPDGSAAPVLMGTQTLIRST